MASKVNIDSISESLSEVLKKADEFNIKKRSILENIKDLERAIPLFERLVSLYEKVGENDPRAKTYFRLAQQIASRNDEGTAAGYNDLKWEAKQADAVNASDRLSNEEAEAIGKLARSSKLSEFVLEFDMENLQRFRQFKELIKAITEQASGMSRKDAQTRRVSHVRDILREYGTGRPKYPANDPYGTLADGDTPFYPAGGDGETAPSGGDNLPPMADQVGKLHFRNGKWYRLQSQSYDNEKVTGQSWKRVSDKKAQAELGPSEYAAIRRRGELEEKAVASIEKSSRYIADLEPAGGSSSKKEKEKKKRKNKGNEQSWGDALLQLAKWAGYGVATLGAIAGAAALVPKVFELVKDWRQYSKDFKDNAGKLADGIKNGTASENVNISQAANAENIAQEDWKQNLPQFGTDLSIKDQAGMRMHPSIPLFRGITGVVFDELKMDAMHAAKNGQDYFYSYKSGRRELWPTAMFLTTDELHSQMGDAAKAANAESVAKTNLRSRMLTNITKNPSTIAKGVGGLMGMHAGVLNRIGLGNTFVGKAVNWASDTAHSSLYDEHATYRGEATTSEIEKMSNEELADYYLRNIRPEDLASFAKYGVTHDLSEDILHGPSIKTRGVFGRGIPRQAVGEVILRSDVKELRPLKEAMLSGDSIAVKGAIDKLHTTWEDNRKKITRTGWGMPSQDWKIAGVPMLSPNELEYETQHTSDFGLGGNVEDDVLGRKGWYQPAPQPNVLSQTYYNQTNVVADDNAQQVGGKQ